MVGRSAIGHAVLIAAASFVVLGCAWAQRPPNIVVIMADDLGWSDVGYNGASFYETPNIDGLARDGRVFTAAYTAGPNCAPTRASFVSGMYPPRHEIYQPGAWSKGDPRLMKLLTPVRDPIVEPWPTSFRSRVELRPEVTSIAEVLNDAGYSTARLGKWHLGPDTQGFDISTTTGEPGARKVQYGSKTVASTLTDAGVAFIEANREQPFFLFLSHWDVHGPLRAKEDVVAKYREKLAGSTTHGRDYRPVYAAMVEAVDRSVGRIVEALEKNGLAEKTVVIFTSDNGGVARFTYNEPLRGGKGSLFEGGIRVPFVVRWPGTIEGGTHSSEPIHTVDLLPTFADLAGAPLPDDQPVDGVSIRGLLDGTAHLEQRPLFWHFPHYLAGTDRENFVPAEGRPPLEGDGWRTTPAGAVRLGKWKLVEFFEDDEVMLFDLEDDIAEENNLAHRLPEFARELRSVLDEWQADTEAPIPDTPNPYFEPERTGR